MIGKILEMGQCRCLCIRNYQTLILRTRLFRLLQHSTAPDIIVENIYASESSAQFIDYENDDGRLGVHSPAIGFGGPTDLTLTLLEIPG